MMRDRISENSKIVGVKLWQPHFNFKTFSQQIGFLTLQVCSLLMRLLSAGPSGECALPFCLLETWRNEAALAALRCAGMLSQECPVLFGFGFERMIGRITHCTSVVMLSDLSGIFLCCLDW